MEKMFVLFIGLIFLGISLSQDDEDDISGEDMDEENSGESEYSTECERMKESYSATSGVGYNPSCLPNGLFENRQCRNDYCFCVDEHGREIKNTRGRINCDSYDNDFTIEDPKREASSKEVGKSGLQHPGIIAGIIGGVVVCLLCAVLIVMFIVYRMKKKDEGSYILGRAERKNSRSVIYTKAVPRDQEFYA